eukprot:385182-Ditylum_brightwellii.AAC.2
MRVWMINCGVGIEECLVQIVHVEVLVLSGEGGGSLVGSNLRIELVVVVVVVGNAVVVVADEVVVVPTSCQEEAVALPFPLALPLSLSSLPWKETLRCNPLFWGVVRVIRNGGECGSCGSRILITSRN